VIWLGIGMALSFWGGYEAAKEYASIAPLLTAGKGLASLLNPLGPSSAGNGNGKAVQSQ
jgi:hypothetical protein